MKKNKKKYIRHDGFTVIELIMVLVFLGVVAVIAIPYATRSTTAANTGSVTRKVKDDIRYAQGLAMARNKLETPATVNDPRFAYRIVFNVNVSTPTTDPNYPIFVNCPGTNKYAIVNNADNNTQWGENPNASSVIESARSPSDGSQYFCVQFGSGNYQGFTVSANFGGTIPGILEFDTNGIPYNSDRIKITAPNNVVTIASGTEIATLTVTPNTGLVLMQ